jgi:organic radical activating enzyme
MSLLAHVDRVEGLRGTFLAPVMVDVTPVDGICNLSCVWCCQAHSRRSRPPRFMPKETISRLGPFCREWGVKAWRVSGEADPTLHPDISSVISSGRAAGLDVGLITNGVYLHHVDNPEDLSYVGVSLDAASAESWHHYKGGKDGDFDRIISNVAALRRRCQALDIALKFLIVDELSLSEYDFGEPSNDASSGAREPIRSNRHELEAAKKLAEALGVRLIVKQAYTASSRPDFDRCHATPLGGVFDAYHVFHLCCDALGRYVLTDDYTREDWQELTRLWGGPRHRDLIRSINPRTCAGCAKVGMNRELEKYLSNTQVNFI